MTFPEYGQLPLISNFRDFKHFKDAIEWSNKFNIQKTSDGQILLAVLYAEAKDPVNAKVHLSGIKSKILQPINLFKLLMHIDSLIHL